MFDMLVQEARTRGNKMDRNVWGFTPYTPLATTEALDRLNARVTRILELKRDIGRNAWNIGRLLFETMSTQDWKQHLDTNGRQKYRSFDKWALEETGLNKSYAYDVMRVSQAFTEKEAGELGITKCAIILQVPPEARARLLKKAKFATVRELQKDRAEANRERKTITRKGKEVVKAKGHGKTEKVKAQQKTQVSMIGDTKPHAIPLYVHAADNSGEPVKAKNIGQLPWGRIEFDSTGIEVQVVKLRSGDWQLRYICFRKE